ncbi:MAG: hypothetical protein AB7F43_06315 [Bacteriovoracia bacterium]
MTISPKRIFRYGIFFLLIFTIVWLLEHFPLPRVTKFIEYQVARPPENAHQIFFWDYSTYVYSEWLDKIDVLVPYEKGPPNKLLSKIYLAQKDGRTLLELGGRKPRKLSKQDLSSLTSYFSSNQSTLLQPQSWSLMSTIVNEVGFSPAELTLFHLKNDSSVTTYISETEFFSKKEPSKGLLIGLDGSLFSVQYSGESSLNRMVELSSFEKDPRHTAQKRYNFTKQKISQLLQEKPSEQTEVLLKLYLASILSIYPAEKDAYFHLGRLSTNRMTVLSMIRYGRDVGLSHAQIFELQSHYEQL